MSVLSFLSVRQIARRLKDGTLETLTFDEGVNVIIGKPNTGKTKWLQTLDYLLGESGEKNPLAATDDARLADKYQSASAVLRIGEANIHIERPWQEPGMIGKVLVNDEPMLTRDFQHFLLEKLQIPIVNYPRGNPHSGQTWPELSLRSLLRHIYRRQNMWADIADRQQEDEQHASLLQFLGLAEHVFTPEYGKLVQLKSEVERLRARRDQHATVLTQLTTGLVDAPDMTIGVTAESISAAAASLSAEVAELSQQRAAIITGAFNATFDPQNRTMIERLGERRAALSYRLEASVTEGKQLADRLAEMRVYRQGLIEEGDRLVRAEDAGAVLADLKVTHCPACDQSVEGRPHSGSSCFLCFQALPDPQIIEDLGAVRLKFERDRLKAELSEADELIMVLERDVARVVGESGEAREALRTTETKLIPARTAMAALIQDRISEIDQQLGQLTERASQLKRVKAALLVEQELTDRIRQIEAQIEPLDERVTSKRRAIDFDYSASILADGMTTYLNALNALRPGAWPHAGASLRLSRSGFEFKIGDRKWSTVLGGTDSLYFLMAYHYGLLTLSAKPDCHYPGFAVIDMPADFVGERIADKENYIVQPFIDLLAGEEYAGAQMIVTGAAFDGLQRVHRHTLTHVYTAT